MQTKFNPKTHPSAWPVVYPLKVQVIRSRDRQPRLYVAFPLPLAAAIGLAPGEEVQWELLERSELRLVRSQLPARPAKSHSKR